ncbi:MAG: hypothetical protein ABI539_02725 [Acidobacteriota bacterium]
MTFLDLIIVYLAVGSPFAIHYYFQSGIESFRTKTSFSLAVFLSWPLYALQLLTRKIRAESINKFFDPEEIRVARLRKQIEAAFSVMPSDRLYETRCTLDRYIGLASALHSTRIEASASNEFFAAAGRKDPDIAVACLDRRNSSRLNRHLNAARKDVFDLVRELAFNCDAPTVVPAISELVAALNDKIAGDHFGLKQTERPVIQQPGELTWNINSEREAVKNVPIL